MKTEEIVQRCTTKLKMTAEEALWVAENLYMYEVPDWSEWSWQQIDECFRGVLWFKDKTEEQIKQELGCVF